MTRTVPSDSTGSDGKDTLISYDGCGCAGGQVTTIQGPSVPRDDDPETYARRKKKIYEDVLGRAVKFENFEWNGSTVYSTIANTYNARDQLTLSRIYAGTTASETNQDTTMAYDGHGRLSEKHIPQQDEETATVYNYYADDSISMVTDARGVETEYTYNTRGLLTDVEWDVGSTGITDIPDVGFDYDNAGNRTSMTDGLGNTAYEYDELSRLVFPKHGSSTTPSPMRRFRATALSSNTLIPFPAI